MKSKSSSASSQAGQGHVSTSSTAQAPFLTEDKQRNYKRFNSLKNFFLQESKNYYEIGSSTESLSEDEHEVQPHVFFPLSLDSWVVSQVISECSITLPGKRYLKQNRASNHRQYLKHTFINKQKKHLTTSCSLVHHSIQTLPIKFRQV